jgi:hypothetical protein
MKPFHFLLFALGLAAVAGVYAHPEPMPLAAEALQEPIPESAVQSLEYEADPHAGLELWPGEMPDDEVHRALRERSERE